MQEFIRWLPDESDNITLFRWNLKDGIPIPVIANGDPAPPELIDTLKCQCKAQGKMCSDACGCQKERLSRTPYCYCSSKEECLNLFTTHVTTQQGTSAGGVVPADSEDVDQE